MSNLRRSGFTMIELIFVIVILGILASVAIPKLAATRDDAKVSTAATSISNAVTEISAFYTATGDFNVSVPTTMSNEISGNAWNIGTASNNVVDISYQVGSADCITLTVGNGDLNITHDDASGFTGSSKSLCERIQGLVVESNNSIGGSSVTF